MLYIFAARARTTKAADSAGKAAAALSAVAAAPPSPASAAPTAAPAAPDARQALCASKLDSAAEVYAFLINNPDRATEIAIVATEWQDSAAERIDAAAPESATALENQDQELSLQESPSEKAKSRKARGSKRKRSSAAVEAEAVGDLEAVGPVLSPACWNSKAEAANLLVARFHVNSGSGVKLGQAITISALLIESCSRPFYKGGQGGQPGAQASGPVRHAQRLL